MKVYTRVVIDMRTLEEVETEYYDYDGPVAECKGGGGGGAGAGVIDYPDYMETQHTTWLTDVDGYMDAAIGNSPYAAAVAYDPGTDLDAMDTAITAFNTIVDAIAVATDYATYSLAVKNQVDNVVISTSKVDAEIAAYADVLADVHDEDVVKLKSGMLDIGATMTSAFTLAEADLYAKKERAVTEFGTRLYVEMERQRNEMIASGTHLVFQAHLQRSQLEGDVARLTSDAKRIRIVARGEEARENYEYDEMDAKWDLEMTTFGANMMASIGGGVVSSDAGKMSKTQSVLSGALSGAAMGAMAGAQFGQPLLGAGVGAVLGAAGGWF